MDSSDNSSEYAEENEEQGSSSENESKSESHDEEEDDDDVPQLADEEYKDMPFEDLLKLQKKLGSRMYNEAIFGKTKQKPKSVGAVKPAKKTKVDVVKSSSESDDDSGPEEISSKRKAGSLVKKPKAGKVPSIQQPRDPRFDPRQGYFSGRQFRSKYGFINDMRSKELRKLKNKLEAANDEEEAEKLKFVIQRTENQLREYAKQKAQDEERIHEKQQTRQAIQEGKRPFFERKSTKKARQLVEQYDKLKDGGKLEKHIDKRRKKISAKDRKKLDFST